MCNLVVHLQGKWNEYYSQAWQNRSCYLILWYDFLWILIKTCAVAYFAAWNTTTLNKIPRPHSKSHSRVILWYDITVRSHTVVWHDFQAILWHNFLWVLIKTCVIAYFAAWNTTILNKILRPHSKSHIKVLSWYDMIFRSHVALWQDIQFISVYETTFSKFWSKRALLLTLRLEQYLHSKNHEKVMMWLPEVLSRYNRTFKPSHPINTTLSFDQNVRGCLLYSLEHYHVEQNTAHALKKSCQSVLS